MQENRLIAYMGKVGGGPRVSKDLTYAEAKETMAAIFNRAYHPVTFGSFTLAMRWKPETAEEMAGFADAMNERICRPVSVPERGEWVGCAGAYDGKERTVNLGIAAALTAAAAGVPVWLHGSKDIPAKCGMTPFHILQELGIDPLRSISQVAADVERNRFGYLHQSIVNPALHDLLEDRRQVGKRTFLNSIEPLINPFQGRAHIGGFFHKPFGELMARAVSHMQTGWSHVLMVAGIEGSDEIKPTRSLVVEWKRGELHSFYVEASRFGIQAGMEDVASRFAGNFAAMIEESAQKIQAFVHQEAPAGYRDIVLLNAGLRIYVGGHAESIEAGYRLAKEVYHGGKVYDLFHRIVNQQTLSMSP